MLETIILTRSVDSRDETHINMNTPDMNIKSKHASVYHTLYMRQPRGVWDGGHILYSTYKHVRRDFSLIQANRSETASDILKWIATIRRHAV